MSEALDNAAQDYLSFGSEIALQLVPEGGDEIGYVGTTTTGSDSCYVNYLRGDASTAPGPQQPRQVRFTVCPPTRFEEKRALIDAEENWAADPSLYTQAQMDDLRFEAERDHEDFDRLKGSGIMFGQRISLHHFASGKSLSFSNRPVGREGGVDSDDALTQMEVIATDEPASGMVLRVMPGFGIRAEGDPVRYGDVIHLKHSKYERALLVFPMQKTGREISFPSPYIEDRQRVVTSDTSFSRLRVMPIATHSFGNMAEPKTYEELMMGGAFVNMVHRESSRLLRVTKEESLTLDEDETKTSAAEDAAHSWCVQDVSMEWSGRTVDSTRSFAFRHSQTDLFLCCNSDGTVTMSAEYADKSCHWSFELVDSDGSIMYDVDSFYIKSVQSNDAGHQMVLRYDKTIDSSGGLSTVESGKHAEFDCFIARYVSHSSISKLVQISAVLENIASFKKNLVIFNDKYGNDMAKQREKLFNMKNTEWAAHIGEQEMFIQMRKLVSVRAPLLLEQLLVTMRGLFPNIDAKSSPAEITDFIDTVIDTELVQVASGMQLVPAIIDLYKNHLFKTPCVLFGGPLCFYGEEIFLAVRLSFRLMGIISRYSEGSAKIVYNDIGWITNQVGLGRFKAAEAISAVLLTWQDLAETVLEDHEEFLPLMWGHVLHDGENKKGNGDHCESLSTVCINTASGDICVGDCVDNMFGRAVSANQNRIADMISADGDLLSIDKLVTTYLGYIKDGMKDKHAEALEVHFRQPLAPTDFEYYVGRLLELVSHLCIGNRNMVVKAASVFSHDRMLKMAVDDDMHPFIRAKSAKLGTVLYMKSAGVTDTAPRIRVPSRISSYLSKTGKKFSLSPEHCEWRDFFFEFMHNLGKVMTPEKRWHNRLARQVFKTVLILFKGGDFKVGRTQLAANMETARTENGLPSAELVAVLVDQFKVEDDAGWGKEPGPDPRKLDGENRVLMHLKLTLIEMILYVFTLWQSTRVDAVVEQYFLAEEQEDNRSPEQLQYFDSDTIIHKNPIHQSPKPPTQNPMALNDDGAEPATSQSLEKNRKNSESNGAIQKLLRQVPMFRDVNSEDCISQLGLVLQERSIGANTMIIAQGEVGQEMFFVVDGTALVYVNREQLQQGRPAAKLGPAHFFGEAALLKSEPRSAFIRSQTKMRLYVLSKKDLASVLQDFPAVAQSFNEVVAKRQQAREAVETLIATLKKGPLLSKQQVDCLIVGCKLVTECEMNDLKSKAFELLFDVAMPDKYLATMVTECTLLRSQDQATAYAELAVQVDELKRVAAALEDKSGGNSPGTEIVAGILKMLEKTSAKAVFSDLQCQVPVVNILIAATSSDLCCQCLQILGLLVGSKTDQQQIVNLALERAVLPALQEVAQQKDVLQCIKTLFKGNRPLCEEHVRRICAVIYQTVMAGCTPEFMVFVMEALPFLISDGNDTYPDCQVVVCRLVCHLLADVKFPGTQSKLFESQIVDKLFSSAEAVEGAALTTQAYIASMRVLGLTAGGILGIAESMCAQLLPLDKVIPVMVQLNEIGKVKKVSKESAETILSAKREVANFLRHVYADTGTKELIGMMQMRKNGIFLNGNRKSVVEVIVADLVDLVAELGFKNAVKEDHALREYVFDSSIPLLYHLLYITDSSGMDDSERKKATASITAACTVLPKLATLLDPVDAEIAEQLRVRAKQWLNGSRARLGDAKKIDHLPPRDSASSFSAQLYIRVDSTTEKQNRSWFGFTEEIIVQMRHVRRKQELVAGGVWGKYLASGMQELAATLWSASPGHYTTDEHPCVKNLLDLLCYHPLLFSTTRLLEALDGIRMVLYYTRALANTKLEEGTPDFVQNCYMGFTELDMTDIPVDAQETMCDYGLLQCCLQIVEIDEFDGMEAAALRMMAASLSGESLVVQKVFLKDLNEQNEELFVSCYRSVITGASEAIKFVHLSSQLGNFKSVIEHSGIFEAAEFLRVIKAVCAGDAQDVQDYIREQPGRIDRNDGISVLVDYLSALERFFPAAIINPRPSHFDEMTGLTREDDPRKFAPQERDMAEFYSIIIEHTVLCLDTIADIADGPNLPNQKCIVDGPLLEGINKLLDCMDLRKTSLFHETSEGSGKYNPIQPFDYKAVRKSEHIRVLDQIIFMLKALLEGPPNKPVHERILNCIKWKAYGRRLEDLYAVLKAAGRTKIRSMRRFETRAVLMFEVVEQLLDSSVLDHKSELRRILSPILNSEEMVAFYRERLGYVEVVKTSLVADVTIEQIEKIYFPLSTLYVNSLKHIEKSMGRVILNKCPLGEDETKLRVWLDLSLELVIETTVSEHVYYWGETFVSKVQSVLANVSGKKGQVLEVCTVAINAAVVLSYHRGGSCPMCRDTFRSDIAYVVFLLAAPLHVFMCMVAFGCWLVVRAPVLIHRISRARKMRSRDKLTEDDDDDEEGDDSQQAHAMHEIHDLSNNLSDFKLMDAGVSLASASVEAATLCLSAVAGESVGGSVAQYLSLKFESEFIGQIFTMTTSAAGLFVSPLFFSFHMFFVVYNSDLEIVLGSFTTNWKRLGTVGAFMVLIMLVYATTAYLVFENEVDGIGDQQGRCTTLLQCFISYSYRGIGMNAVADYLPDPQFPTTWSSVSHGHAGVLSWETGRLVWEASFNLITISMLGAIITGIICDSFGALRDEKDTAELYRKTHNFITGIPFAVISEVNQPAPKDYFFFLLYLEQKQVRNLVDRPHLHADELSLHNSDREPWGLDRLTASEEELDRQIDSGDVSWIPRETCIYMQHVRTNDQIVLDRVDSLSDQIAYQIKIAEAHEEKEINSKLVAVVEPGSLKAGGVDGVSRIEFERMEQKLDSLTANMSSVESLLQQVLAKS